MKKVEQAQVKKIKIGYDEAFKIFITDYFSRFAKVTTDFEIIDLPKKVDLIIIEEKEPIVNHVKLLIYFKKFNIIEFKSRSNPFKINEDLYKIGIYIGGYFLRNKMANPDNTTFSLVCSRSPKKFLRMYKNSIREIMKGLYLIEGISILPVFLVVVEKIRMEFIKEIKTLKEFSNGKDLYNFLKTILIKFKRGEKGLEKFIKYFLILYKDETKRIIKKEGIVMNRVERNLHEWIEELGLKKRYIEQGMEKGIEKGIEKGMEKGIIRGKTLGAKEGRLETARRMLRKRFPLKEIANLTGLNEKDIKTLR